MGKRIIITGGSGKAGQHIINHLLSRGHELFNIDLVPLPAHIAPESLVHTLRADLTDSGQVHGAFTSHFKITEPFRDDPLGKDRPDAVIHLAGYSRNMIVPDNETFRTNTMSTYNVIEAACRLGIKKVIIASSVTVYGVSYAEGDVGYPSFPVDEEVDANPMDSYAIAKVCGERVARGFTRRFPGVDIYVLRIGRVVNPEEYREGMFASYVEEPEKWAVHGWSYIDSRDLGEMCHLGVEKDGLGFQVFNATNDEITNYESSTRKFLERVSPGTPFTREMGEREAPLSNRKIKELLGFRESHPWQKYYESK
ncbi:NAD-dependent epimerase/dehydratase family protein [Aspergillus ruber CBS 135680]|uniref:NAD(P)-binding protein n=1 Tax=Aspergillus ruber (strain CBS 135680) TaxID=1388766 RepID=A0A017SCH0_ASPRC|nr:NAD(P)-binding protein [Aspergillus ruber CBS 135680]EYE94743.1 NAD(P)-binding protein [Aspergillus ruber CBS 135680]